MSEQTYKRYVLYISSDDADATQFCYGSRECLKLIEPIKEDVTVQHVDRMLEAGVEIPDWLDGTPILVNTVEKSALRGTGVYEYLKGIGAGNGGAGVNVEGARKAKQVETDDDDGFSGITPHGEKYLHESTDDDLDFNENTPENQIMDSQQGKITEDDVQKYMELRNKQAS
tara:strand:+ start:1348 stop:1860 length:513 start_codon:yes stop_codon:yes gene_type:complete